MTTSRITSTRAWPVATLAAWSGARDAGRCAPDDVLHSLHDFAQVHEIDAAEGVLDDGPDGALGLLALLSRRAHLAIRMPAPGDAQGLPAASIAHLAAPPAEVLLIDPRRPGAAGPVAAIVLTCQGTPERCRWTAARSSAPIPVDRLSAELPLGEIEYELREAVSQTASMLAGLAGSRSAGPTDLPDALAGVLSGLRIDLPPHDNPRVDRVLASADRVDAILALTGSGGLGVSGAQAGLADDSLRRLSALSRTARSAALNTLLTDYRRG